MTKRAVSGTAGRVAPALLLCALLAACGTTTGGQPAGPAPVPALTPTDCGLDHTTDETTDEGSGAYAGPPTDQETGGYAGPPTDQETGGYAGPPTDGEMANGGGPCGSADWFDMTRDFKAYLDGHLTKGDDGLLDRNDVREARVRKVSAIGEAKTTFYVGLTDAARRDEAARRLAELFTAWRHEVYGDKGTVTIRTPDGSVVLTQQW
ncbi:hypothetical protein [Streptomyces sp. ISL-94]|uniref:hypothetical protein n=1 Tax=Streptomyces sp. ISL-94 TaxID=2819190 RepID=UPI001BE7C18D|nr:hypothetical protein [Streptomyces sp. ISL-94]MBT2478959.1 hypothetical protein [Streptomyces sp. ISL-94]